MEITIKFSALVDLSQDIEVYDDYRLYFDSDSDCADAILEGLENGNILTGVGFDDTNQTVLVDMSNDTPVNIARVRGQYIGDSADYQEFELED